MRTPRRRSRTRTIRTDPARRAAMRRPSMTPRCMRVRRRRTPSRRLLASAPKDQLEWEIGSCVQGGHVGQPVARLEPVACFESKGRHWHTKAAPASTVGALVVVQRREESVPLGRAGDHHAPGWRLRCSARPQHSQGALNSRAYQHLLVLGLVQHKRRGHVQHIGASSHGSIPAS
jgi:hypothetical protein